MKLFPFFHALTLDLLWWFYLLFNGSLPRAWGHWLTEQALSRHLELVSWLGSGDPPAAGLSFLQPPNLHNVCSLRARKSVCPSHDPLLQPNKNRQPPKDWKSFAWVWSVHGSGDGQEAFSINDMVLPALGRDPHCYALSWDTMGSAPPDLDPPHSPGRCTNSPWVLSGRYPETEKPGSAWGAKRNGASVASEWGWRGGGQAWPIIPGRQVDGGRWGCGWAEARSLVRAPLSQGPKYKFKQKSIKNFSYPRTLNLNKGPFWMAPYGIVQVTWSQPSLQGL